MWYYSNMYNSLKSIPVKEEILEIHKVRLTHSSTTDIIFSTLDGFEIPYKDKSIPEVLALLFDRLLYEYMEDQSCYNEESYKKFKNTFIYYQMQMMIYHVKAQMLWLYNNDVRQIPKNAKILFRKTEINPIDDTSYVEEYNRFKMYMEFVTPNKLSEYFNSVVGLNHFSVRTKALYHAFVEELELRGIDYDIMLYGNERMLSYHITIEIKNNKLTVIKK